MVDSIHATTVPTSFRRNRTNGRERGNDTVTTKTLLQPSPIRPPAPCHHNTHQQELHHVNESPTATDSRADIALYWQRQNPSPLPLNRSSRTAHFSRRQSKHSNNPRHSQPLLHLATCSPAPPANSLARPQDLIHKLDQRSRSATARQPPRANSLIGAATCPHLPTAECGFHRCYARFLTKLPLQ